MFNFMADPEIIQDGVIDVEALLAWVARQEPVERHERTQYGGGAPTTPCRQRMQTPIIDSPPKVGPEFYRGFFFATYVPTNDEAMAATDSLSIICQQSDCLAMKVMMETFPLVKVIYGYVYFATGQSELACYRSMRTLPSLSGMKCKGTVLYYRRCFRRLDVVFPNADVAWEHNMLSSDEDDSDATAVQMAD